MLKSNLPDKPVPRAEHDHRAREARLRLEQVEQLLVPNLCVISGGCGVFVSSLSPRPMTGRKAIRTSGRRMMDGPVIDVGLRPLNARDIRGLDRGDRTMPPPGPTETVFRI
jgi:hypothetical protein